MEGRVAKYSSGVEDSKCPNPDCKKEFADALDELRKNLYGEGPEGDKGVYGAMKKKVGYGTLLVVLSIVCGAVAFFAGLGINHESRISKSEATIERNTGIIKEIKKEAKEERAEILSAIRELKR